MSFCFAAPIDVPSPLAGEGCTGVQLKLRGRGVASASTALADRNPSSSASRHLPPQGGRYSLGRREEWQRRAVGRLEHPLHLLADLQYFHIAVDKTSLQRRTLRQRDLADRVRPGRRCP